MSSTAPESEPLLSQADVDATPRDPESGAPGPGRTRLTTALVVAFIFILGCLAGAFTYRCFSNSPSSEPPETSPPPPPSKDVPTADLVNLDLHVLPLGDSITNGYGSTHGNGYRRRLHSILEANNSVTFLGRLESGSMDNSNNEGYGGAKVHEIRDHEQGWLGSQAHPNVILLHAGTNDCAWGYDPGGAPARLGAFVDDILGECEDTVLLVGTLLRSWNSGVQSCFDRYNAEMVKEVEERRKNGAHVTVVDMTAIHDDDMGDFLHPSDQGYRLMAVEWWKAMQRVHAAGWIKNPA